MAEVMWILRENDVPFVVAPFEADWQLAYMSNLGLIQGIISTDSDYWALIDHPCLISYLSPNDLKALVTVDEFHHLCFRSCDSLQSVAAARNPPIHHMTRFGAIVRATVYGNDYFKGLKGVGEKTLESLITKYHDDQFGLFYHLASNYHDFVPLFQRVEAKYYDA